MNKENFLRQIVGWLGLVLIIVAIACGSSDTGGGGGDNDDDDDDNGSNGDNGDNGGNGDDALTLTSDPDDDGFTPGGTIPDEFACDDAAIGGDNVVPKLTWSDAPEETQSFALTIIDLAEDANGYVHGLLVNLPSTKTSLTQNDTDIGPDNIVVTYFGPCPVDHPETHTYEATIYALNVEEITVDDPVDTDAVIADIEAAAIESDSIQGSFTAPDAR